MEKEYFSHHFYRGAGNNDIISTPDNKYIEVKIKSLLLLIQVI